MDPNLPPMEFIDQNGGYAGFDIDLIKVTFNILDKKYDIRSIDWGQKEVLLDNGAIDLIWSGLGVTDERVEIFELSVPYLSDGMLAVVPHSSDIQEFSQMADKKIGTQKGTYVYPKLEEFNRNNSLGPTRGVKEYHGTAESMTAMLTGEVDVVLASSVAARYYVANSPGKFRILPGFFLKNQGVAVAARKGETELIEKINRVLMRLSDDGTIGQITERWLGDLPVAL